MKRIYLFVLFCLGFFTTVCAQLTATATWMGGDSTVSTPAVFGTKGVADPANNPGGRYGAVSWTDKSGKFWLLGGYGVIYSMPYAVLLNDLWMYDPSSGNWTWMKGDSTADNPPVYGSKGVADPANKPNARIGAASWTDPSGKFWLMGGDGNNGASGNLLNDLWMYDPATNNWTWVSGTTGGDQPGVYGTKGVADPANTPGGRSAAVGWTDAKGKLWLMGGGGHTSSGGGELNDLWMFDPSTSNWTWVSGGNTFDPSGNYGTKGVADPANQPWGRFQAVSWTDASGNFWLLGGAGYNNTGGGTFNDLWMYNPSSGNWTWIGGDSTFNQASVFGTKGVADPANKPGGTTLGGVSWTDASGKLWLMGGAQYRGYFYNTLWQYDPSSGNWTWVGGDSTGNSLGLYGTKGVADSANKPQARGDAVGWRDASGKLWLMGGSGFGNGYFLNDLWRYDIQLLAPVTVATSPEGASFSVDGKTYTSSQTFHWLPGSSHTLNSSSPQNAGTGTRYVFSSWSDGGTVTHTVKTPSSATSYTVTFNTQYLLTTSASIGGSVSPAAGYYNAGSTISVSATANAGYGFSGFSGALTGTTNPQSLTLTAPASVVANFTAGACANATNLTTTNITATTATLKWTSFINPAQWQVQYKSTATGTKWIDVAGIMPSTRSVTISGLKAKQTYQWHIQAKCGSKWTGYSTAISFKTGAGATNSTAFMNNENMERVAEALQVQVLPNPSSSYFTLVLRSATSSAVIMHVFDEVGRTVESKSGITSNSTERIGFHYKPGVYYAQIIQGDKIVTVKLMKQ